MEGKQSKHLLTGRILKKIEFTHDTDAYQNYQVINAMLNVSVKCE